MVMVIKFGYIAALTDCCPHKNVSVMQRQGNKKTDEGTVIVHCRLYPYISCSHKKEFGQGIHRLIRDMCLSSY